MFRAAPSTQKIGEVNYKVTELSTQVTLHNGKKATVYAISTNVAHLGKNAFHVQLRTKAGLDQLNQDQTYGAFYDSNQKLGNMTIWLNDKKGDVESHVFIQGIKTYATNCNYVSSALEEYAFRESVENNKEGRVMLDAAWDSPGFHFKNGFRSESEDINQKIMQRINEDPTARSNTRGLGGIMYLPEESIKEKLREFGYIDKIYINEPFAIQYLYIRNDSSDLLNQPPENVAFTIAQAIYWNNAISATSTESNIKTFDTYEEALKLAEKNGGGTIIKINEPLGNRGEMSWQRAKKGTLPSPIRDLKGESDRFTYHLAWIEPYNKARIVNPTYEWAGLENEDTWQKVIESAAVLKNVAENYLEKFPKEQKSFFSTNHACQKEAKEFINTFYHFYNAITEKDADKRIQYYKFISEFSRIYSTIPKGDALLNELNKSAVESLRNGVEKITGLHNIKDIAYFKSHIEYKFKIPPEEKQDVNMGVKKR